VLGFESFDAGSHRSVREMISAHSRHEWTWLTRPARGWKWRMRLAAVELLEQAGPRLAEPIDAMVVTSLMSAADLRALLPARLRATPIVLYMHENQAAYPLSDHPKVDPKRDVHFALTNLTSILAADLVIWNSQWNRSSFLDGMDLILRRANAVELTGWQEKVEQRSRVIWPHRWEHDKGPDELLEFADRHSESLDLRWTILGERYPDVPPALAEFERRFADRIDHFGYEPDRRKYWQHLARADWVLSTAQHEYFGIAVAEALLAGCLPWLPARLSYPELLPPEAHGLSPQKPPKDPQGVIEKIRAHLEPALAPNAVTRIDETISEVARTA
jgi:glycosyltransferase involved in cell wall biosynthesis